MTEGDRIVEMEEANKLFVGNTFFWKTESTWFDRAEYKKSISEIDLLEARRILKDVTAVLSVQKMITPCCGREHV